MKKYFYSIFLTAIVAVLPALANAADYLTVAEAMTEYNALNLSDGSTSAKTYTIRGYITEWVSGYPSYQNGRFYIDDKAEGSTSLLFCYNAVADNDNDKRKLSVGEYVEITGKFKNYQGQAEIVNGSFHTLEEETPPEPVNYYTVAEIRNVYSNMGLASGYTSTETFIVRGYVTQWKSGYPNYQNADFYFDDSADSSSGLECYRLTATEEADKRTLNVGELVEATAKLKNYNGRCELVEGTFRVVEGETPPSTKTYTLTISAGVGGTVNSEVNGTYEENTKVTIKASANDGYKFAQWSDGNTSARRVIKMTKDITLQAQFEKEEPECLHPELEGKKGEEIREYLRVLLANHTVMDYDDLEGNISKVDAREDGQKLWDIYTNCSKWLSSGYKCSSSGSYECDCYNREHTLPKSFWGGSESEPMYTDMHHVFSTDKYWNSKRSNWPYAEVDDVEEENSLGTKIGTKNGYGTVFEPADEYKGDIARVYFYMLTCYADKNFTKGNGSVMFEWKNSCSNLKYWAKKMMLRWHREDPVSQKEIDRNDKVEAKQRNRNPFVDDPDLVEYIWGDMADVTYTCNPESAIEDVQIESHANVQKVVNDGHLYILLDGQIYSIMGVKMK